MVNLIKNDLFTAPRHFYALKQNIANIVSHMYYTIRNIFNLYSNCISLTLYYSTALMRKMLNQILECISLGL